MDILVSSNLERLLFEVADRDGALVKTWMDLLKKCGSYSVGDQRREWLENIFWGGCSDDNATLAEIGARFQQDHYLLDTHTAVASNVLRQYRAAKNDATPTVLVSTASPYKFAADVAKAIGVEVQGDAFDAGAALESATGVPAPKAITALKFLPVLHTQVCDKDNMGQAVLDAFDGRQA